MGCSSSSFEGESVRPGMQEVLRATDFCKDFCKPFWRKPCPCMKLEAMHRAGKEGFRSADFHKPCFWLNVKFTWFKSVSEQISNKLDGGPAGSCYVWAQRWEVILTQWPDTASERKVPWVSVTQAKVVVSFLLEVSECPVFSPNP